MSTVTRPARDPEDGTATQDGPPLADARNAEIAGQWRLIWWKFRRHRLAMVSGVIVLFLYVLAVFAEFFAPADPNAFNPRLT